MNARALLTACTVTAGLVLVATPAQAVPRKTCTDTTTVRHLGWVTVTSTVRTCPGIRYELRWVTVGSKTRLVVNTWPSPVRRTGSSATLAPRR